MTRQLQTIEGVLQGVAAVRYALEVPPDVDYLLVQLTPSYYEPTGVRFWLNITLFDPVGNEVSLSRIQVSTKCSSVPVCSKYFTIESPVAGQWTIELQGSIPEGESFTGNTDYEVKVGTTAPLLTSDQLEDTRMLVVSDPGTIFFPEELESISYFVRRGGALLLIEVPYYWGYSGNTLFSLANMFGIDSVKTMKLANVWEAQEFRKRDTQWPNEAIIKYTPLFPHPVVQGISRIIAFRSGAFTVQDTHTAQALLQAEANSYVEGAQSDISPTPLVVAQVGYGRIVAVGDPAFAGFWRMRDSIWEVTVDYGQYDNALLSKNIVDWLLQK